jgi:regulator of nucleoside diphosphate kinase
MTHDDTSSRYVDREATQAETILVGHADHERLRQLIDGMAGDPIQREAVSRLDDELERAEIVDAANIPGDVITLESWARLLDLDSDRELLVSPVMPTKANADAGRLSILAPLGMAVLGYRAGDTIEWPVPGGMRRLRVLEVMFQPEAYARRSRAKKRRSRQHETA